jgi:hypothetical protein
LCEETESNEESERRETNLEGEGEGTLECDNRLTRATAADGRGTAICSGSRTEGSK